MAKTRLGILPIRIETGRYERPKLDASKRHCLQCNTSFIEDEAHFLLYCVKHEKDRALLLSKVKNPDFPSFSTKDKLSYLLSDSDMIKHTAQFILKSLDNRVA